jgi:hypothetical protein
VGVGPLVVEVVLGRVVVGEVAVLDRVVVGGAVVAWVVVVPGGGEDPPQALTIADVRIIPRGDIFSQRVLTCAPFSVRAAHGNLGGKVLSLSVRSRRGNEDDQFAGDRVQEAQLACQMNLLQTITEEDDNEDQIVVHW